MATLEMARVDRSLTAVLSPVASARTQPTTLTSPGGGAGTSSGDALPTLSVIVQPRSTSSAVPSGSTSGTTTSTPEVPLRVR